MDAWTCERGNELKTDECYWPFITVLLWLRCRVKWTGDFLHSNSWLHSEVSHKQADRIHVTLWRQNWFHVSQCGKRALNTFGYHHTLLRVKKEEICHLLWTSGPLLTRTGGRHFFLSLTLCLQLATFSYKQNFYLFEGNYDIYFMSTMALY